MVKPIIQLYPVIPAADEAEREAIRPAGRSAERYQEAVHGMTEIVKAADELGFWGVSTIEHHFHSEGYEIGPAPGILNAHWAAVTKNVNVGCLGYTMSAQNPLRVAEETAILNHMCRGRSFVGFSRGYQPRWTNVLGQHVGVTATSSPAGMSELHAAQLGQEQMAREKQLDRINRDVFEEHVQIVIDAWTQDSIEHVSERWQIPYPAVGGIDWKMRDATRRLGAPGEIGDDGNVHRICVTPAPLTKPHPPVFVGSNASLETVEYCGSRGFIPAYFSGSGRAGEFGRKYVERAREVGYDFALGQNQGLVRWMQIGETNAAARRAVADYDLELYRNMYRPLTPVMPFDERQPVQSMLDCGLWMCGTPEEVREQFVRQWEELPAEYVVLVSHYAQQPLESVVRNMELFIEHVKPALDELTEYAPVAA